MEVPQYSSAGPSCAPWDHLQSSQLGEPNASSYGPKFACLNTCLLDLPRVMIGASGFESHPPMNGSLLPLHHVCWFLSSVWIIYCTISLSHLDCCLISHYRCKAPISVCTWNESKQDYWVNTGTVGDLEAATVLRSVGHSADRQEFLYQGWDVDKSITDLWPLCDEC